MKTITITTETIAKLEAAGFKRWSKGRFDRLYINPDAFGVRVDRYNTGNIRKVTWEAAEDRHISNSEGYRILSGKYFVDLTDGTLHVDTRADLEDLITETIESLIDATLAEPETVEDETTTEATPAESIVVERADGHTQVTDAATIASMGATLADAYALMASHVGSEVARVAWMRGDEIVAESRATVAVC